jgi:CBS-domain-containing membrane protein
MAAENKQTSRPESASELYRPSDRRSSAKLVPTFADIGCHVLSVTDPYRRILGFLDRSRYFCTHEAEWSPFQTHYFSENLVALGIEPGPLDQ